MAGGLMQIATYGTQDLYLTGSPQITFFKTIYRRYTNFAVESMQQYFDGVVDFDSEVSITLAKNGDLINKIYLELVLPCVHIDKRCADIVCHDNKEQIKSKIIFYTYKLYIDSVMDVYRFIINELNKKCRNILFIRDYINNHFFKYVKGEPKIIKLLIHYYTKYLKTPLCYNNNKLPYNYIINIIQNHFVHNILFCKIELKKILDTFFQSIAGGIGCDFISGLARDAAIRDAMFSVAGTASAKNVSGRDIDGRDIDRIAGCDIDGRDIDRIAGCDIDGRDIDRIAGRYIAGRDIDRSAGLDMDHAVGNDDIFNDCMSDENEHKYDSNSNSNSDSDSDNECENKKRIDIDNMLCDLRAIMTEWYGNARIVYLNLYRKYNSFKICNNPNNRKMKFAWIKKIGHYIINHVELLIGGKRIDKQYGEWLNIWYELSRNVFQDDNYDKMIGNIECLTCFDNNLKPEYRLYIPLQFWFCRHTGSSLPMISLNYHDVQINLKLAKLEECAYVEPGFSLCDTLHIKCGSLFVDYVFLDRTERNRFATCSHEYLIEQVQREIFDIDIDIDGCQNMNIYKYVAKLNFLHPCKEIIWVCQFNKFRLNPCYTNCLLDRSNYSNTNISCNGLAAQGCIGNPIIAATLEFNNYIRLDNLDGCYFNYVQPYENHSSTPSDGINVYSFALQPELLQPSGTANFSRLNTIVMHLTINPNLYVKTDINITGARLTFYALNYNIFRIMSGMGGLAFGP